LFHHQCLDHSRERVRLICPVRTALGVLEERGMAIILE
jgi:hypothetical protein